MRPQFSGKRKKYYKNYIKNKRILNSWYGRERSDAEAYKNLPKPKFLGDVLDGILQDYKLENLVKVEKISSNWKILAGNDCSDFAKPVSLENRVLNAEIKHSLYLKELKYHKKTIIKNINMFFSKKICTDIKFIPRGSMN